MCVASLLTMGFSDLFTSLPRVVIEIFALSSPETRRPQNIREFQANFLVFCHGWRCMVSW